MEFEIVLLLSQYLIFCNQYDFTFAKALMGENVRPAEMGEFSYVVSIMHHVRQGRQKEHIYHMCTGALITQNHVLTAAHCFQDILRSDVSIKLGSTNLSNARRFNIVWWITYNEWRHYRQMEVEFKINDVAVLKLRENVPNEIQPGVLSPQSNSQLYGESVFMTGWGVSNNYQVSTIMQVVEMTIITNTECESRVTKLHGSRVPVNTRLLCTAAEPYAFLDHGDSGGPLVYMNRIVGVNKAIIPISVQTPHPEKVNVHTSVDYYRNFILDVIDINFQWS